MQIICGRNVPRDGLQRLDTVNAPAEIRSDPTTPRRRCGIPLLQRPMEGNSQHRVSLPHPPAHVRLSAHGLVIGVKPLRQGLLLGEPNRGHDPTLEPPRIASRPNRRLEGALNMGAGAGKHGRAHGELTTPFDEVFALVVSRLPSGDRRPMNATLPTGWFDVTRDEILGLVATPRIVDNIGHLGRKAPEEQMPMGPIGHTTVLTTDEEPNRIGQTGTRHPLSQALHEVLPVANNQGIKWGIGPVYPLADLIRRPIQPVLEVVGVEIGQHPLAHTTASLMPDGNIVLPSDPARPFRERATVGPNLPGLVNNGPKLMRNRLCLRGGVGIGQREKMLHLGQHVTAELGMQNLHGGLALTAANNATPARVALATRDNNRLTVTLDKLRILATRGGHSSTWDSHGGTPGPALRGSERGKSERPGRLGAKGNWTAKRGDLSPARI